MKTITSLLSAYLVNSPKGCMEILQQCHNIGTSLNDRGHRFYKAKLIDKKYSRIFPYLKYVDELGYDWMFCGNRVSSKSQKIMFGSRVANTYAITLVNKRTGEGKDCDYLSNRFFDYIVLTQTSAPYAIAVANYDLIRPYFKEKSDCISVMIPYDKLDFIIHPSENIRFTDSPTVDYGKIMDRLLDQMLDNGILKPSQQYVVSG